MSHEQKNSRQREAEGRGALDKLGAWKVVDVIIALSLGIISVLQYWLDTGSKKYRGLRMRASCLSLFI